MGGDKWRKEEGTREGGDGVRKDKGEEDKVGKKRGMDLARRDDEGKGTEMGEG